MCIFRINNNKSLLPDITLGTKTYKNWNKKILCNSPSLQEFISLIPVLETLTLSTSPLNSFGLP